MIKHAQLSTGHGAAIDGGAASTDGAVPPSTYSGHSLPSHNKCGPGRSFSRTIVAFRPQPLCIVSQKETFGGLEVESAVPKERSRFHSF